MRTVHTFYGITADLSDELVEKYAKDVESFPNLSRKLEVFAELDGNYLRDFLQKNRGMILPTIRMLESHGNSSPKSGYLYTDLVNDQLIWHPVNEWLDQHDGKYDVLYVSVCNPGEIDLEPRISTLVYPLGLYKGEDLGLYSLGELAEINLKILPPQK